MTVRTRSRTNRSTRRKPSNGARTAPWLAGWQGRYMVTVGDTRHGKSADGRLVSDDFTIDQSYLKFLYGGEVNPRVFVALRVDGK